MRGAEADLPSFGPARLHAPWLASTTTSVAECARRIADGIARPSRRVYVPRGVAVASLARPLTYSALAERLAAPRATQTVPRLEEQVARLGRAFARHVS